MKIPALAFMCVVVAVPALAQEQERRPPQAIYPPPGEQVAEVPQVGERPQPPAVQRRHPGTVTKLRGAFSSAPVVEGDEYPEGPLGLPQRKER